MIKKAILEKRKIFWKALKGENVISAMKRLENGQLSRNCAELPKVINNHFSSLDPNLAAEILRSKTHFSITLLALT